MGIVPLGNLALLFSVFSLFPWEPVTSLFWFLFSAYSPRVLFPLGEPSDAYSLLGLYYHSLLLSSFPSLFSLCLVWVLCSPVAWCALCTVWVLFVRYEVVECRVAALYDSVSCWLLVLLSCVSRDVFW